MPDVVGTSLKEQGTRIATALPLAYSATGVLNVRTGAMEMPVRESMTIVAVRARVGTAPTGASLIVDVNKNGTTIFTGGTGRPTIAAAAKSASGTPAVTALADGDYLTVDIDQVGSTIPGSDLTVTVYVVRA